MPPTAQVSTRILGRRTAPSPPFLIPNRVPHGFTQDPSTDLGLLAGERRLRTPRAGPPDAHRARPAVASRRSCAAYTWLRASAARADRAGAAPARAAHALRTSAALAGASYAVGAGAARALRDRHWGVVERWAGDGALRISTTRDTQASPAASGGARSVNV